MKKLIIVATAVLAFGNANAQDAKFGAKLGLNIASQSTTVPNYPGVSYELSGVVGVNVGAFAEFKISNKFAIQPELLYSMQGVKLTASLDGNNNEATLSMNYINLPIMAKFMATEKFSLQAGPQIGFLMTATIKRTSNYAGGPNDSTDVKDEANTVDFGLNFGAGYDITEKFSVDLRYNIGLSGVEKNLESNQTASKNRVLSLNLGYSF